jgi:hypothetical protein
MNPISYYQSLITSEYQNSPKFLAFQKALLQPFIDVGVFLTTLYQSLDINNAEGIQLDIIGEIVGQARQVNFQFTDGSNPILNDMDYQVLLKAKIAQNMWKGKIGTLQPLWNNLFPGEAIMVIDNQDMTMNVFVGGDLSLTIRDLVRNGYIVPRPEGVLINYYFFGDVPVFGFDLDNEFIKGFNKGHWARRKEVKKFAFDTDDSNFSGFDKGYWSN